MINDLQTIKTAITPTGYFSNLEKQETIISLPKSSLSYTKYWSISLLGVTGKVVEKIINTRLTALLEYKGLTNYN